MKAEVTLL